MRGHALMLWISVLVEAIRLALAEYTPCLLSRLSDMAVCYLGLHLIKLNSVIFAGLEGCRWIFGNIQSVHLESPGSKPGCGREFAPLVSSNKSETGFCGFPNVSLTEWCKVCT